MQHTHFFLIALLASCTKEELELAYTNQEKKIEEFVNSQTSQHPEYTVANNSGVTRLTVSEGSGESLGENGTATIFYAAYNFSRSTIDNASLIVTNNKDIASGAGWDTSDESKFVEAEINPSESGLLAGLALGLPGIEAGEECLILFSGRYGTGKESSGTIPANTSLAYRIWVMQVKN